MVVYEFDDIIINGENVVMLLFIIVEFEVVFDDDLIVVECDQIVVMLWDLVLMLEEGLFDDVCE